jgi:superfamily I DNA and/or RNA helicase
VRIVGELRAAGVTDVMVVSPYNMQVNALKEALPGVAVGTVDKFQGQEADAVVYSMASSTGDDVPRGLEFLLSRNRLNVAVSRARCLAYLVASPRLLEVNARTIAHMRLANALCRFVELAR